MFANLFETWNYLASEEATLWENKEAITLQRSQPPCHTWVMVNPSLAEQDALQAYVQRCIENRGWAWQIDTGFICNNRSYTASVTPGGFFGNDESLLAEYESPCCYALLHAYLKAICISRPIEAGHWVDYLGRCLEVHGIGVKGYPDRFKRDYYTLEGRRVSFSPQNESYSANGADVGILVFFVQDKEYKCLPELEFLGLVSEPFEYEGKIRFCKIKEGKNEL